MILCVFKNKKMVNVEVSQYLEVVFFFNKCLKCVKVVVICLGSLMDWDKEN